MSSEKIWTPESSPPTGYKLVIHRYYTEIVPIGVNIPKTPIKTGRFMYPDDLIIKGDKGDNNDNNDKGG